MAGRTEEAAILCQTVAEGRRRLLGEHHPDTIASAQRVAEMRHSAQRGFSLEGVGVASSKRRASGSNMTTTEATNDDRDRMVESTDESRARSGVSVSDIPEKREWRRGLRFLAFS